MIQASIGFGSLSVDLWILPFLALGDVCIGIQKSLQNHLWWYTFPTSVRHFAYLVGR